MWLLVFFFKCPATTEIYTDRHTLSLHDALPIFSSARPFSGAPDKPPDSPASGERSSRGRSIVVFETISASIFRAIATPAISSTSAGSRSGATFRNTGGPPAPRDVKIGRAHV